MNTYLVIPPEGNQPFEVEAADHWLSPDNKAIIFVDDNHDTVATYIAHPGTLVRRK
jgi:hypothetical protein